MWPLLLALPVALMAASCDSSGGNESSTNAPPTAQFTYTPSTPTAGMEVQFDASASSDDDGSIASYEWTLSDESKASGPQPTHVYPESITNTYAEEDQYEVTLTVTDDGGASDEITKTVVVAPTQRAVDWEKVWGDEFDGEGLPDASKWYYETGGDGWGNGEQQYYTKNDTDNVRVRNGHLIIEARHESYQGNEYTSARLNSEGSWTYGRFVIRAKLPSGRGTWPAIWMLPDHNTYGSQYWPDNGEIDVMEHVGYDPGVVHGTIHTEAFNHIDGTDRGGTVTVSNATSAFHTYAMEWTPTEIRVFADGQRYFTFRNREQYGWQEWPFDHPFHLLLNIAVGGSWGGAQGIDDTAFPAQMVIDYVRVYKPE